MHVYRALFHIDIRTPYPIEQLRAAVNAVGMCHQEVQQAVLGGTESNIVAVRRNTVAGRIEFECARRNDLVIGRPSTAC